MCSFTSYFKVITSWTVILTEYGLGVRGAELLYTVIVGKYRGKKLIVRLTDRHEGNIRMDVGRGLLFTDVNWI
jgi:hypothetical protein